MDVTGRVFDLLGQGADDAAALMAALNQTEPHYIRCIKPNTNKSAAEFDARMILNQV